MWWPVWRQAQIANGPGERWLLPEMVAMEAMRDKEFRATLLINLLIFGYVRERGIHKNIRALKKDAAIGQVHWETDSASLRFRRMTFIEECFQEQYL